jgi:hypothetical protein
MKHLEDCRTRGTLVGVEGTGGPGLGLRSRRAWRTIVIVALVLLLVASWVAVMNEAGQTLSFEANSDSAIADASQARPGTLAFGFLELMAAIGLAGFAHRRWLSVLGLPGVAAAVVILVVPGSNGGALVLGLTASLLGLGMAAACGAREIAMRCRSRPVVQGSRDGSNF